MLSQILARLNPRSQPGDPARQPPAAPGAWAAPALSIQAAPLAQEARLRAWLAADGYPGYPLEELLADPVRAQVAELVATRGDADRLLQLLTELLARSDPAPVDRMLLAEALLTRGSFEQARDALLEAAADPGRIGARAAALLAEALFQRGEFASAGALIEASLARVPDAPASHLVHGQLLDHAGRGQEALEQFRRAVALRPASMEARVALAIGWLRLGDLRQGFGAWVTAETLAGEYLRESARPAWDGRPLRRDRVLILTSNGYGDVIQLLRFAAFLREREPAARLSIQVRPALAGLVAQTGWFERVYLGRIDADDFDWQVTLTHIPLLLDLEIGEVGRIQPYLRIDKTQVSTAAAWLPARAPGRLRVGLRWSGDPARLAAKRNLPFEHLRPLFAIPGIDWVALVEQPGELEGLGEHPLLDVTRHLTDFSATGALLHHLDLVISVDTSVVHLAGGLNLPVWLLARPDPEWRWGRSGATSPWYGSVRIFRHPEGRLHWEAMVADVAAALKQRLAT
jgi:tetratricopeptide (TPR) repeat protein